MLHDPFADALLGDDFRVETEAPPLSLAPEIARFVPLSAISQEQREDEAEEWTHSQRESGAQRWLDAQRAGLTLERLHLEDVTKPDLLRPTGRPPEPAQPEYQKRLADTLHQIAPVTRRPRNIGEAAMNAAEITGQSPMFMGGGVLRPDVSGGPLGLLEDAAGAAPRAGKALLAEGGELPPRIMEQVGAEAEQVAAKRLAEHIRTAGTQSSGELLKGIGHRDVSPDIQADIARVWENLGQKPETVSWDETVNDLAPKLGETPESLAQKWNGMPRAEASTELAIGNAGLTDYAVRIANLNQKMEAGVATEADMMLWSDLKLRQAELMLGLRRAGGEAGRSLNILRMGLQEDAARLAEITYRNIGRITKEATDEVTKAARNGTMSPNGRGKLGAVRTALEHADETPETGLLDEAARRPWRANGKPRVTGTEKVVKDTDPSLAEQIIALNREQRKARDSGTWDRVDELEVERQGLLGQLDEKLRAAEERRLANPKEFEPATLKDADRILAQQLTARMRATIREELLDFAKTRAGIEKGGLKFFEQLMTREATRAIDRALRDTGYSTEAWREANVLLDELSTQSGYADEVVSRFRETLAKRTQGVPHLSENVARINREAAQARDTGDFPRLQELTAERAQYLTMIREKLANDITARQGEKPAATMGNAYQVMGKEIVTRMRREVQETMRSPAEIVGRELAGLDRRLDVARAKETINAIDSLLNAAPNSAAVRVEAEVLLKELSTLSGWADQAVRNYRETRAQALASKALGAKASPEVVAEFARMDWTDPRSAQILVEKFRQDPTTWAQIHAARVFSMLLNTGTQIQNTMGNALNTLYRPLLRRPIAAGIEAVRTLGGRRGIPAAELSDASADLAGMAASYGSALQEFKATWQTGISSHPIRELDTRRADPIRIRGLTLLNRVGRLMAATDDFFGTLNEGGAMMAEANIAGRQKGISADQILVRMVEFPGVIERGAKESQRATFRAPLTGMWADAARLRKYPVVQVLLPFFNTQANIARIGSDISPLGLVRDLRVKNMLAEQLGRPPTGEELAIEHANVRADTAVGIGLTGLGAMLAAGGIVNHYGPIDQSERDAWLEAGNKPNSIMVNGEQLPLLALGQFAIPVLIGAASVEAARAGVKHNKIEAGLASLVHSFGRLGLDQSGLRAVDQLMDILTGKGTSLQAFETFLETTSTGGLPPGLVGQFARMTDETMRDPDGAWEAVLARIPGVSQGVAPKLDRWGQEQQRELTGLGQTLPLASSIGHRTEDPVRQEVLRLNQAGYNVGPQRLGRKISGADMTAREHFEYRKIYGVLLDENIRTLMETPAYEGASDGWRADAFEDQDRKAHREALRELKAAFPDLKDRIEDAEFRQVELRAY